MLERRVSHDGAGNLRGWMCMHVSRRVASPSVPVDAPRCRHGIPAPALHLACFEGTCQPPNARFVPCAVRGPRLRMVSCAAREAPARVIPIPSSVPLPRVFVRVTCSSSLAHLPTLLTPKRNGC